MAAGATTPTAAERTPERALAAFAVALRRGDIEAAAACFAPGARLLTPDGTAVSGAEGISEVLASLAASFNRVEVNAGRIVVTGRTALCFQRWRLSSSTGAAEAFEQTLHATLVLRHFPEGWRIQIAAPWGL